MRGYHIANVVRAYDGTGWQALCACGWVGPVRVTLAAANDDALAHDEAANA